MSIARLQGTIYPDKSFSIGTVPVEKITREDAQYKRHLYNLYRFEGGIVEKDYALGALHFSGRASVQGSFCSLSENPVKTKEGLVPSDYPEEDKYVLQMMDEANGDYSAFYDSAEPPSEAPLFNNGLQSSRKEVSSYGKKGITKYGRRVLENSALLLQKKYGKQRLGFGTVTLPSLHKSTLKYLLSSWGEVVRRFFQKLKRITERVGCPFIYVGCTEIQPERFDRTRLPVPHLHFVYVAKFGVRDGYLLLADEDYKAWNDAVNEVLALGGYLPLMGVDGHVGSLHLKPVKQSASAYIGKYISKGLEDVKAMQDEGYEDFPKQWWFASMQCKEMFKLALVRIHADTCEWLFRDLYSLVKSGLLSFGRYVEVEVRPGVFRKMGATGRLSADFYRIIVSEHKKEPVLRS